MGVLNVIDVCVLLVINGNMLGTYVFKSFEMSFDKKEIIPHIFALLVFVTLTGIYFAPMFEGKKIYQGDIVNHKGMSKELVDYHAETGELSFWTNRMFGGMPATQISVVYKSNILRHVNKVLQLGLPHPINVFFIYMIGLYIFLCAFVLGLEVAIFE